MTCLIYCHEATQSSISSSRNWYHHIRHHGAPRINAKSMWLQHANVWSHPVTLPYIYLPTRPIGDGHGHQWSIYIPLVPCQSVLPFRRQGYFRLWPCKFNVAVKGQGPIVNPVSNRFASSWFRISQTDSSWDTVIYKQSLGHILDSLSNRKASFSFHMNRTNRSQQMANTVFDLEKSKFEKKMANKWPSELAFYKRRQWRSLPFLWRAGMCYSSKHLFNIYME